MVDRHTADPSSALQRSRSSFQLGEPREGDSSKDLRQDIQEILGSMQNTSFNGPESHCRSDSSDRPQQVSIIQTGQSIPTERSLVRDLVQVIFLFFRSESSSRLMTFNKGRVRSPSSKSRVFSMARVCQQGRVPQQVTVLQQVAVLPTGQSIQHVTAFQNVSIRSVLPTS